jgi:serine/threonine protein phosphatase 1
MKDKEQDVVMSGPSDWLKRMVGREKTKPSVPSGRRVIAIGDIHGRRDLLDQLLANIAAQPANKDDNNALVFLGDYIDRGPDSKGVVDRLLTLDMPGWDAIFLRGNHEQAILDFLRDPPFYRAWKPYGAPETLLSYGVMPPRFDNDDAFQKARDALARVIP